ncbi:hypothetical protein [Microbacterium sp. 77mftsu3.1]|uniref:hypothetical protein n=1 Tax=Microbacterium sp. 77mftsu3.1 TaxID=1761802 RepID=UPI00036B6D88|nr:hypothetical protein [Microbacterium sp. 77mftsu3.1]SDH34063.1 hypothetical protein SAMN04488590_3073 [Microbacterium sp. 77mftsu3.1]
MSAQEHLLRSTFAGDYDLQRAYDIAKYAHDGQSRWAVGGRIPYIYHPVDVYFRLLTWGVKDKATLVSALLHDSVEDAPERVYERAHSPLRNWIDLGPTRQGSLNALGGVFGDDVQLTLDGLTNEDGVPYLDHVIPAVQSNPRVLIAKTADVWGNGIRLSPKHPRYAHLSTKYVPLYPVLAAGFRQSAEAQALCPAWPSIVEVLDLRAARA